MVVILWSRVGGTYGVRGTVERQDAEKRRVSKILCDLRGGRGASSDGAEGKVVGCKGGGMRETKV